MNALLTRIAELTEQVETLQAENARLLEIAAPAPRQWIPGIYLKPKLSVILGLLVARECASREAMHFAIYQDADDAPELKIIDVFVVQLRRELARLEVTIRNRHGEGWLIDEPTRRAIAAGEIFAPGATSKLPADVWSDNVAPADFASIRVFKQSLKTFLGDAESGGEVGPA